jgi:hypothetical protein
MSNPLRQNQAELTQQATDLIGLRRPGFDPSLPYPV